jgi:hypothetical protein
MQASPPRGKFACTLHVNVGSSVVDREAVSASAPWALAMEPRTMHFTWSDALRSATIEWMPSIMDHRVNGGSGTIQALPVPSGDSAIR